MTLPEMIAIDGPAASGKSTVAERLAAGLGYLYFDTGVMYRAVTYAALKDAIPITDEAQITALAERIQIDVRPASLRDGRKFDVWLEDEDISWKIRQARVDAEVSVVSAYPGVRQAMTCQQRRIGQRGRVVMVGRDIGTVVLPEAGLKIYLDASVEARARRRYNELAQKGNPPPLAEVLASMKRRDAIDSNRACAPLRPADDSVVINSDNLTIEQVLEIVRSHLKE
jgi:CMP/dCMP kinase